jgi:hypothetical protein
VNRLPYTITIFVPDGDPDGIRVIEKFNWSGQGVVVPRPLFDKARRERAEQMSRTGVYVLVGPGDFLRPKAYVGEGEILDRLAFHSVDEEKDFWTSVVFFVSKDATLNKAHVEYLEARLFGLAKEANRCQLANKNQPQMPGLSEADRAEAESFLTEMCQCFPLLGMDMFTVAGRASSPPLCPDPTVEPKADAPQPASGAPRIDEYSITRSGAEARGYESARGFTVAKGSLARGDEVDSIPDYAWTCRADLKNAGVLVEQGDRFLFTQDYEFPSPSSAAGVVLGASVNGRTEWKTRDGQTLKAVQEGREAPRPGDQGMSP